MAIIETQTGKRRVRNFPTVAAMVASRSLVVGEVVETNEYFAGTGGGNRYEMVSAGTGTVDGGSFIDVTGPTVPIQAKGIWFNDVITINQFGAIIDGVSDNGVISKNAQDYALANSKTLHFHEGRYNYTTRAETEGVGVINITADPGAVIISNVTGGGAISLRAVRVELSIGANITRGDLTFDLVSAAGITVGQHFTLRSEVAVESLRGRPARHTGTIVAISGNTLTVDSPIRFNFATSDTGVNVLIFDELVANVENLSFEPITDRGMDFSGLRNSTTDNLTFTGVSVAAGIDGLFTSVCSNITHNGLKAEKVQYGILSQSDDGVYVNNIIADECRHGYTPQRFTANVWVNGIRGENNIGIMDSHGAFNVNFRNVYTTSDREFSNLRSAGGSIRNSHIQSNEIDSPSGDGQFQNIAWNSPYGKGDAQDIYAETDFITDDLTWIASARFGCSASRLFKVTNSKLLQLDGSTLNGIRDAASSTVENLNTIIQDCEYDTSLSIGRDFTGIENNQTPQYLVPAIPTHADFDGGLVGLGYTPTAGGTGYSNATTVDLINFTGSMSGSGATVDITTGAGIITSFDFDSVGSGYVVGDVLKVDAGGVDATITVTLSMLVQSTYGLRGTLNGQFGRYTHIEGLVDQDFATGGDVVVGLRVHHPSNALSNAGVSGYNWIKIRLMSTMRHDNSGFGEIKETEFHGVGGSQNVIWDTPAYVSTDTGQANATMIVTLIDDIDWPSATTGKEISRVLFFRISSGRTNPRYSLAYDLKMIHQVV